jgi:alkylglycerol monooxygenase
MDARFVAVAIPLFFVAIGLELLAARRRGVRVYRFADAISALSCGLVSQVAGVFTIGLTAAAYAWVYDRFALLRLEGWVAWVVAFVAVDAIYYAWHRASHRVGLLWAGHAAHHQSEDYNLAVALRQTVLSHLTSAPFYWVLGVVGVPPAVLAGSIALNTLYQFWIHTRLVGKLGPMEWVLNTPSHHRVHHGIDRWAIDKNYAGVLIVWDRLFGTFEPERHEPTYGVVEGFPTWSPIAANFAPLLKIARAARAARGLDRLRAVFGPPEWTPAGPVSIPDPTPGYRWDPPTSRRVAWLVTAWFALVSPSLIWLIVRPADALSAAVGAGIVLSTVAWARLLTPRDSRPASPRCAGTPLAR